MADIDPAITERVAELNDATTGNMAHLDGIAVVTNQQMLESPVEEISLTYYANPEASSSDTIQLVTLNTNLGAIQHTISADNRLIVIIAGVTYTTDITITTGSISLIGMTWDSTTGEMIIMVSDESSSNPQVYTIGNSVFRGSSITEQGFTVGDPNNPVAVSFDDIILSQNILTPDEFQNHVTSPFESTTSYIAELNFEQIDDATGQPISTTYTDAGIPLTSTVHVVPSIPSTESSSLVLDSGEDTGNAVDLSGSELSFSFTEDDGSAVIDPVNEYTFSTSILPQQSSPGVSIVSTQIYVTYTAHIQIVNNEIRVVLRDLSGNIIIESDPIEVVIGSYSTVATSWDSVTGDYVLYVTDENDRTMNVTMSNILQGETSQLRELSFGSVDNTIPLQIDNVWMTDVSVNDRDDIIWSNYTNENTGTPHDLLSGNFDNGEMEMNILDPVDGSAVLTQPGDVTVTTPTVETTTETFGDGSSRNNILHMTGSEGNIENINTEPLESTTVTMSISPVGPATSEVLVVASITINQGIFNIIIENGVIYLVFIPANGGPEVITDTLPVNYNNFNEIGITVDESGNIILMNVDPVSGSYRETAPVTALSGEPFQVIYCIFRCLFCVCTK